MLNSEKYDRLFLVIIGVLVGETLGQMVQHLLGEVWYLIIFVGTILLLGLCGWLSIHHHDKEREERRP